VPEQDRSRLFLFVLGVAAVHALCLAAVLPALFTLPGQETGISQGAIKQDAIVRDTIVNVEVMPSSQPLGVPESSQAGAPPASQPNPVASLASATDRSDVTSALPEIPQNVDTAPGEAVVPEPSAPVVAATPSTPDLVGSASPALTSSPSPTDDAGTSNVSGVDPTPTNAIPQDEAKPATNVALPTEKPKPDAKPRPNAAKTAKPHLRRQASVTSKTQSRGMFGGFFQSQPRPKTQRATATR
jgi:hypothetical protein